MKMEKQPREGLVGELDRRFKPEWRTMGATQRIYETFRDIVAIWGDVREEKRRLSADKRYSPVGVASEIRNYAKAVTIPVLDSNNKRLEGFAKMINERHASLAVPKPDPANLVQALVRQEARTFMRGLTKGDLLGLMLRSPDLVVIQAALEAPAFLVNAHFDQELRTKVEQAYMAAAHPEATPILHAQEEAMHLAGIALEQAVKAIADSTNFLVNSREFDQWMQEASSSDLPTSEGLKDGPLKDAVKRAEARKDFAEWMKKVLDEDDGESRQEKGDEGSGKPEDKVSAQPESKAA